MKYPELNSVGGLAAIAYRCGWGGLENIEDEGFKQYVIERCRELGLTDYLPDSWGGDERGFE